MYGTGEQMSIFAGDGPGMAISTRCARLTCLLSTETATAPPRMTSYRRPTPANDDGQRFIFRPVIVSPYARRHAEQVKQDKEDIRTRDYPVDVLLFHQPAFRRDVKFPFVRIDQRDQSRRCDIPCQYRFIDFTPERVTILALNLRVSQAGVDHVRYHK